MDDEEDPELTALRERIENSLVKTADSACKKLNLQSCVIIATVFPVNGDDGLTLRVKGGYGNFYAQEGSVRAWLQDQEE